MELHEVREIVKADEDRDANTYLDAGYRLIAIEYVTTGELDEGRWTRFVLGRPEGVDQIESPSLKRRRSRRLVPVDGDM